MNDSSYLKNSPAASQWRKIGIRHHHGIAIPLFSIHSAKSFGIGEYTDLPLLIDWCASIGFDIIQLLPLNDTEQGISPYSAVSAFALNPIFLGLQDLPDVHDHPILKEELNALPKFSYRPVVEYTKVREHKEHFMRRYFEFFGPKIIKSADFEQFCLSAHYWLKDYAVFKILKKRHHWMSWEIWPEAESKPSLDLIDAITREEKGEYDWICFLQYLCDRQMKAASEYALQHKISIMGDIPILINRDSADVWTHRELFDLSFSAGAPPDMFTELGQNWGFPIYQWKTIAEQNYQWWIERLQWASRYYHIYRIDHIVGFFRIWAIPLGLTGIEGNFLPKEEVYWIDQGQKIMLMMLNSSDMLPIGEDLGVVPPEVRKCLSALGICGTRVMRWERKWNEDKSFISLQDYAVDTLTTVSTHDTETLQQWWKHCPLEAEKFAEFKGWSYQPSLSRENHREILWDSHHSNSLFHINFLQEYLALIPGLSWSDLDDERINVPGIFNEKNWCYRLRPSLEDLAQRSALNHLLKELIL